MIHRPRTSTPDPKHQHRRWRDRRKQEKNKNRNKGIISGRPQFATIPTFPAHTNRRSEQDGVDLVASASHHVAVHRIATHPHSYSHSTRLRRVYSSGVIHIRGGSDIARWCGVSGLREGRETRRERLGPPLFSLPDPHTVEDERRRDEARHPPHPPHPPAILPGPRTTKRDDKARTRPKGKP